MHNAEPLPPGRPEQRQEGDVAVAQFLIHIDAVQEGDMLGLPHQTLHQLHRVGFDGGNHVGIGGGQLVDEVAQRRGSIR